MSEEIIKVLDNLGERFGIAIDWTNQNVMPYIQELMSRFIKYRNITGVLQIILWIILLIISIVVTVKLIKWSKSDKFDNDPFGDDEFWFVIGIIFSIIFIIIASCFIFGNVFGIAKNIILPEMTIVDYLRGVI